MFVNLETGLVNVEKQELVCKSISNLHTVILYVTDSAITQNVADKKMVSHASSGTVPLKSGRCF